MTKVKLVISYDGTDFHGFSRQQGLRTVQGTLEGVLTSVLDDPVEVFGSGRTDAGVHARRQVVHFSTDRSVAIEKYPYLLRRSLPPDIVAVSAHEVPDDFHARFSALSKTYRYTMERAAVADVFAHRYCWHFPLRLNLDAMQLAARHLIGTHDYTSFCASSTPIENKRRTIHDLQIVERGTYWDFFCTGNGFLQHMVRIIVGTLVDVGYGKYRETAIPGMLAGRDRRLAGRTAPPQGLALWDVQYPEIPEHS